MQNVTRRPIGGLRGFRAGWRWGSSALGMALRRPIYFGLGWVCLGASALAAEALPSILGIAMMFLVISGAACTGSAARAQALAGSKDRAPWSAWREPLTRARRLAHALRVGLCAAVLVGVGFALQTVQIAGLAMTKAELGGEGPALIGGLWILTMWALLLWCVVASAPVAGWRAWRSVAGRAARAPMAILGFAVFLGLWIALGNVMLVWLAGTAMGSEMDPATRMAMSGLAAVVSLSMSAPLVAMGAGIASLDLVPAEAPPAPEAGA